jgi:small subunit ribosomal protein S13
MIRIASVTLPDNKQIRFALSIIRGVGKSNVKDILSKLSIAPTTKVKDLTDEHIFAIRTEIDVNYVVEEDLMRQKKENIAHYIRTGTYRGLRHKTGMPVRGQTTKTNSRTVRGNVRKTAGSGRIKSEGKT